MNSGRPVWHVSIARWSHTSLITTDRWGEGVIRAARRRALQMLEDVGMGEAVEKLRPSCLHVRRSLSAPEMALLTAEWLAIPARDEFSIDGVMEMKL